MDTCSKAIDLLLHLVMRTAFDFDGSKRIAQDYVDEFVGALIIGLRAQKEQRDARIERLI